MKKVIVIGLGAAGLMAAYQAGENNNQVTVIERNEKPGKKIYITGKGRCNVTNDRDISEFFDKIIRNKEFLYSSLYSFSNYDLMELLKANSLKLKVERGGRVFPESDKASDVIKTFEKMINKNNVNIVYNKKVSEIVIKDNVVLGVKTDDGKFYPADKVILATGGKSYPSTGSDGSGYLLAKKAGHRIITPTPALVGLITKESWVNNLSGLTLKNVSVSLCRGNKKIKEEFGELLFTHEGISGPTVITLSSFFEESEKDINIKIDLKPALDEAALYKRLNRDFEELSNKDFSNSLNKLMPKSLAEVIVGLSGTEPGKKVNQITKEERKKIVTLIKGLTLGVKGKEGFNRAVVTAGGVDVKEINSSTMESKLVKNLYFAGEIIDVHAQTGGFNLQIAFSTGFLAGSEIK